MLEPINALADGSPGFVWRLQSETGDATGIRAFDDDRIIVNLSVWETIEALGRFVFASRHNEVLRRRRDWFEQMAEAHLALWWIPAGTTPTVEEAERRLATLRERGPSSDAFTLREPFPAPGSNVPVPSQDRLAVPDHRAARVRSLARPAGAGSVRPFRMKRSIPFLVPLVVLLRCCSVWPLPRRRRRRVGQFVLRCGYSHSLTDDPIVFPGQPGASHLHDFFGNTGVERVLDVRDRCSPARPPAASRATPPGTGPPPAFMDGVQVKPGVMRIYYLGPAFGTVETIPAGLQMVGGNKEAQSPAENPHVSWSCGQTKSVTTPREDTPYDCTPWAQLRVRRRDRRRRSTSPAAGTAPGSAPRTSRTRSAAHARPGSGTPSPS